MKLVLITATLIVMAGVTMGKATDKIFGGMSVKEIEKMAKEMDMDEYHKQTVQLAKLTRYKVRMRTYLVSPKSYLLLGVPIKITPV